MSKALKNLVLIPLAIVMALTSGIALRKTDTPTEPPTTVGPSSTAVTLEHLQPPVLVTVEPPAETLNTEPPKEKLVNAPLDAETQWSIYAECDYDNALFCTVMAIAAHESTFDPRAVGDSGKSLGLMQINTRWHSERVADLGITDLMDPVQSVKVAVDIIRELESRYGFEAYSEELLISYNMGPDGARKAISKGITSTEYSRTVITLYEDFLAQLGG